MRLNWMAFKRAPKLYRSIEEAEAQRNPAKVRWLWIQGATIESVEGRLHQFSRLESLEFRSCPNGGYSSEIHIEFSQKLRREILELQDLKSFAILNTPIREFPIWLAPLPKLENLMVRGTEVREIPAEIKLFSRLRVLELGNNDIREVPVEVAQIRRLEELGLHSTLIQEIPLSVLQMPKLRVLQLTGTDLSCDTIAHIKQHFPHASLPSAQPHENL